ncbi:pilin [Candidatus Wolfebacteria bacterium]|nr:pilin [Candidatus Wolfebacteria bacterium]
MYSLRRSAGSTIITGLMLVTLVGLFAGPVVYAQDEDPSRFFGLVPCTGVAPDPDRVGPPAPNEHPCTFTDLVAAAQKVIDWLLYAAVFFAATLFSWAGFLYVTSAGETGKVSRAHGIFKNVLIGFIIALAAWLIVHTITTALLRDQSLPLL